jgi:multiple sugar transport system ATP-binding protein
VALGFRPEQIGLRNDMGASQVPVTVSLIDPMGADSLLWGSIGNDTVSIRIGADETYATGTILQAYFNPQLASLFDSASGKRL